MFGTDIKFFYKGQEQYKTYCGGILTVLAKLAYVYVIVIKCINFIAMTDPDRYFTETHQSLDEPIDLVALGFTFAVENPRSSNFENADDLVIELHQVEWDGYSGEKVETQLVLEPCGETSLINDFALNRLSSRRKLQKQHSDDEKDVKSSSYLCPSPSAQLVTQGSMFEEKFSYVRLRVRAKSEPNQISSGKIEQIGKLRLYMPYYSVDYDQESGEQMDAIKRMTDSQ